jgi:glycosyltransferase involved in cell wall biosynthesis
VATPKFTAVIPAYNAEQTLAASVRSVLAKSEQDFELVIVDDGSTDATAEVARTFVTDPRVRLVQQENSGLAASRNTGIEQAAGEYVAFLDSDDLWMPAFLEATGGALDADPAAGFAYTDGWALDDVTRRIRRTTVQVRQRPPVPPPREADAFLRELVWRNFVLAEATVRLSALHDVGPFNTTLAAVEDYELWLRMVAHGYRALRPPGLLLIRRDRPDSMSKDHLLMNRAHREVWRMVAEEHPAPPDVKAVARRKMADMDRLIAATLGEGSLPLAERARGVAGSIKRRIVGERLWLAEPPPEVAAAFPELFAGGA